MVICLPSNPLLTSQSPQAIAAPISTRLVKQKSLVVVDPVEHYPMLLAAIPVDYKVHLLAADRCGIAQISELLQAEGDVTSLHIISHGQSGELRLGTSQLNLDTLRQFQTQLQQWRNALAERAEILLYGCEVAQGATGQQFVEQLAALTGTRIAASTTLTGNAAQGGDWHLQVQTGPIQSSVLAIPTYPAVLVRFSGTTNIGVGSNPYSVTLGDVNDDGNLDLLTVNRNSNDVSVRLGDGTGGFSGTTSIGVGWSPTSVTLGDVNGDGNLDLLTANNGSHTVSVRLGDGNGGFSGTTNIGVGVYPWFVRLGDVNGDGNLDLLTANNGSDSVSLRLGDGNGGFSGTTNIGVGFNPYSVALGDVNGDGKLDILTANTGSNDVSVRLGDGTGGFSGTTNIGVGLTPSSVTLGDVNGDGNLDLLTANLDSNDVSVRLGDGNGGFSGTTNIGVGVNPWSVTLGDVNGDGKLDILTANNGSNDVSVRLGDGNGGFSGTTNIGVGANPWSVTLGDVNEDGKLDLLVANAGSNDVSVRLNTTPRVSVAVGTNPTEGSTNGTFIFTLDEPAPVGGLTINFTLTGSATSGTDYSFSQATSTNITAVTGSSFTIAEGQTTATLVVVAPNDRIADPNEIISLNLQNGSDYIVGNATARFVAANSVAVGARPNEITLADVNGDGKLDLLTVNNSSNTVSVRLGDGTGGFSDWTEVGVGLTSQSIAVGDVNGDGNLDLLTANTNSNDVSVRLGDGNGGFSGTTGIWVGSNPTSVTLGDVNGDGKLDLLTANYSSNEVAVRLGDGNGGFSGSTSIAVGSNPMSVTLGDVNGDGNLDLLTANLFSNTVSVRLGDGNGGFTGSTEVAVGAGPRSVTLGDINGDGNLDLLAANSMSNRVSVRLGDGTGNFSGSTNILVGLSPQSVKLADINSDGKLDLITANYGSNSVSVRLGDGNGDFSSFINITVGDNPQAVTLGDVNGDGKLDILTTHPFANNVSVWLNQAGADLTIADAPPNSAPALTGTPATLIDGSEDTGYTINAADLLIGFTDADGDLLSVSGLTATNGTLTDNNNGTWTFTPNANYYGIVNLSYDVSDSYGGSISVTQSFTLTTVNDAPALTGTQATLTNGTEDTAYTISAANLLTGFTDVDGNPLSVSGLTATNGTLVDNNNGTWTFTPIANYNGVVNLSYNVTDGNGGSTPATRSFTLAAVNDAPALTGTQATLANGTEDTDYTIFASDLLAGFTDVDGDSLSVRINAATRGYLRNNNNGTWTYRPDFANTNGVIFLSYDVIDGNGGWIITTQSFTLTAVNDAPTGSVTITGTATQGQTLTANNTLADVDGLGSISYQWQADGVDITGATGNTFVLGQAQVGKTITVKASYTDGGNTNESVTSAPTNSVTNVNDAPTGSVTITGTATQGQTLTANNTLADVDGLGSISYQWQADGVDIAGATGATLLLGQAQVGKTITVRASYTDGGNTTETITSAPTNSVANVNDAPALTGTAATLTNGTEDTAYTINASDLLAGFTDAENDPLSVSGLTADNGILVDNNNGTWTFTPNANFNGTVNLNYNVTDGNGGSTDATQSFAIAPVNDAPALTGTAATLANGTEDTAYTINASDLLAGFTDIENDLLSVSGLTTTNGTLIDNGNDTWTFTPDPGFNGKITLSYAVIDDNGGSTSATQSLTVDPVNDVPVPGTPATLADSLEDTAYRINATDLLAGFSDNDGDTLAVTGLTATDGTLVNNNDGTWTFTPTLNFNGTVNLSYEVTDGNGGSTKATQSFVVTPVNDAPLLTGSAATLPAGAENAAYTLRAADLLTGFTDVEGNPLLVTGLTANNGTLINNNDGTWTFNPTPEFYGTVTLNYTVSDGNGGSTSASQTLTLGKVAPMFDISANPILAPIPDNFVENSGNTIAEIVVDGSMTDSEAVAVTAVDNRNGIWQYSLDNGTTWTGFTDIAGQVVDLNNQSRLLDGSLTGSSTHRIRFVPNPGFNDTATLSIKAWDKTSGTAGGTSDTTNLAFSTALDTVGIMVSGTGWVPADLMADPLPAINFQQGRLGRQFTGSNRADKILGTPWRDILRGGNGNDRIASGFAQFKFGNDRLFGDQGNDWLDGGNGQDWLDGGEGNDVLLGGRGNDMLIGGAGNDQLAGGKGRDTFVWKQLSDAQDVIRDFEVQQDVLDLRAILTQPAFSAARMSFSGNGSVAQLVRLVQVGSNTEVRIDSDGFGAGLSFMTLATLNGVTASSITAANFVSGMKQQEI